MNIRRKVMGLQLLIFILVLVPLTLLVDHQVRDLYVDHLIDELNEESEKLRQLPVDDQQHHLQSIIADLAEVSVRDYLLLDQRGKVVISTLPAEITEELLDRDVVQRVLQGVTGTSTHPPSGMEDLFYFNAGPIKGTEGEVHGALLLFASMEPVNKALTEFRLMMGLLGTGALMLAAWLLYAMAGQMVAPLLKMKDVTGHLANRNYRVRVEVGGEDEVGQLSKSINELATRLQHHEERQQDFLADVTHELRTPLSYLQGYSQVLEENWVQDEEERKRYLALIVRETRRLKRLVSELTELSEIDADGLKVERVKTDFAEIVRLTEAKLLPAAEEKGIRLRVERRTAGSLLVIGDPDRLEQVLFNLLTNAISHTAEGEQIVLRYRVEKKELHVQVQDTGAGIPASDLPHIFDRFYRVEKSRNRERGGMGLGLAIAKGIIDRHGGQIWVESIEGSGTTFSFTLPLA
ncbi:sensor histidine kinase [Tumebacillus lipolyticus]|uniref:histidine kinase n=1 Tax=Tumebacillus lipolyticus TaxID=1280370 RepID=A0ABW5A253_9BACL